MIDINEMTDDEIKRHIIDCDRRLSRLKHEHSYLESELLEKEELIDEIEEEIEQLKEASPDPTSIKVYCDRYGIDVKAVKAHFGLFDSDLVSTNELSPNAQKAFLQLASGWGTKEVSNAK